MGAGEDAAVRGAAPSGPQAHWRTAGYLGAAVVLTAATVPDSWSLPGSAMGLAALVPLGVWGILARAKRPWLLPLVGMVDTLAGFDIFLGLGLFALAVRRRDRMTLAFAVLGSAAVTVSALARSEAGPPPPGTSAPTLAWLTWGGAMLAQVGVPLLFGAWIGTQRELLVSLRARALAAEAERQLRDREAVLQERERMAHEMHDSIGHQLTLVAMHAGALTMNPGLGSAEVHQAELIRSTARQALVDLRQVVGALQEPELPNAASGIPAVRELVARSREVADVTFDERLPEAARLPEATSRALSRIVQEGLTNAHRHAPGAPIELRISGGPGIGVDVEMANRLTAETMPAGNGTGLAALAERVRVLGGSFVAGTSSGLFRLTAQLPWPPSAEHGQ